MVIADPPKTYDFSWAKSHDPKCFRFRDGNEEVFVQSIEGYVFIEEADAHTGHMKLRCDLTVDADGNATLDDPMSRDSIVNAPADAVFAEAHQMCFARKAEKWRIWDKERRQETVQMIDGYHGPTFLFWPRDDHGGHVFAYGRMSIVDGIANFYGDSPHG